MRQIGGGIAAAALTFLSVHACPAQVCSDGSDGPLVPGSSVTIPLEDVAPDGILNYTIIHIQKHVTVRFTRNSANTPVFLCATGDVLIEGTVEVSRSGFTREPGPGGWQGGKGSPNAAGEDGAGHSGGGGGPLPVRQGNAGGGAGMSLPGLAATSRTGDAPAPGGPAIARPRLRPGTAGGGGSGGGGGGGRLFYTTNMSGGDGGGGGGALQISTPGKLTLAGSLIAGGHHGGWSFANVFAHGGPGGGGAGGQVELYAGRLILGPECLVELGGGAGGGLSTEPVAWDPYLYSSGAHGGLGYLFVDADHVLCHVSADLRGSLVLDRFAPVDFDRDGDVDADDLGTFLGCVSGPGVPHAAAPDCLSADLDADADVDQADFGGFQRCYAGPSRPVGARCAE